MSRKKSIYGKGKSYLSYSAISLWLENKASYRRRYYELAPDFESPSLLYGKKIASLLEADDPLLKHVPRYACPEFKIETDIDGVPMLAYIDSFDPAQNKILEYKTGTLRPDGLPRWNENKVMKSMQLPLYSLMVEEKFGFVDPETILIWLKTKFVPRTIEWNGHILVSEARDIELDGEIFAFKRIISKEDRQQMKKLVKICHDEITRDFKDYMHSLSTPDD